jgi:hypothetical protein
MTARIETPALATHILDTTCFRVRLSLLCVAVKDAARTGNHDKADALYDEVAAAYDRLMQAAQTPAPGER